MRKVMLLVLATMLFAGCSSAKFGNRKNLTPYSFTVNTSTLAVNCINYPFKKSPEQITIIPDCKKGDDVK